LLNHAPAEGLAKRKHRRKRKNRRNRATAGLCTPLENVCIPNAGRPCCANTKCVKPFPTNKVAIPGSCQSTTCTDDAACAARFPGEDVYCEKDSSKCAGLRGSCCLPKPCDANSGCPHSALCCPFLGVGHCCVHGQICTFTGCYGGVSK
jgi:hypothetical protein